jgi:hypothetical protein
LSSFNVVRCGARFGRAAIICYGRDGGVWNDLKKEEPMDLKQTSLKAAERINQDETESLARLAVRLTQLQEAAGAPDAPESDLAHALRNRRMLRKPLSTAR